MYLIHLVQRTDGLSNRRPLYYAPEVSINLYIIGSHGMRSIKRATSHKPAYKLPNIVGFLSR